MGDRLVTNALLSTLARWAGERRSSKRHSPNKLGTNSLLSLVDQSICSNSAI